MITLTACVSEEYLQLQRQVLCWLRSAHPDLAHATIAQFAPWPALSSTTLQWAGFRRGMHGLLILERRANFSGMFLQLIEPRLKPQAADLAQLNYVSGLGLASAWANTLERARDVLSAYARCLSPWTTEPGSSSGMPPPACPSTKACEQAPAAGSAAPDPAPSST